MDEIIDDGIFYSTPLIDDWGNLENIVTSQSLMIDDLDAFLQDIIPTEDWDFEGLFNLP